MRNEEDGMRIVASQAQVEIQGKEGVGWSGCWCCLWKRKGEGRLSMCRGRKVKEECECEWEVDLFERRQEGEKTRGEKRKCVRS